MNDPLDNARPGVYLSDANCTPCIAFKGGYKYQLKAQYTMIVDIKPVVAIRLEYVQLECDGRLTITTSYAWDGPSGPTVDTKSFMRASLVHDALYQLMREGGLDRLAWRDVADRTLQQICLEDGMWPAFAWIAYQGVRLFANPASDPANRSPIVYAPDELRCSRPEIQN